MTTYAFVSHSKNDPNVTLIGTILGLCELTPNFMEFEDIEPPPWRTIKKTIEDSRVVFVLLNDVLLQEDKGHTRNWIDFEVGIACEKGLDVWVIEPNGRVDFSVPYVTHQYILSQEEDRTKLVKDLKNRIKSKGYNQPKKGITKNMSRRCIRTSCGIEFQQMNDDVEFMCPSCRMKQKTPTPIPGKITTQKSKNTRKTSKKIGNSFFSMSLEKEETKER